MPSSASLLLLPERLLDVAVVDGALVPRYLTERDRLWVDELVDCFFAMRGRRRADVQARLAEHAPAGVPRRRLGAMTHLLVRLHHFAVDAPVAPRALRRRVFGRAARLRRDGRPIADALSEAASGCPGEAAEADELRRWLYADVPAERMLRPPAVELDTPALIERYNLALAQSLLLRAERLAVTVEQNIKGLLRFARLQGLLCLAQAGETGTTLQLSGPLSILRHTTKYGRALAVWLPVVVRTPGWRIEADCLFNGRRLRWTASARDPIGTTHAPLARFDSRLEARFFRDLQRCAPSWRVLREADPVQLGRRVVCPDFTLVDDTRGLRVPVELVGFWTERYLRHKLALLDRLPAAAAWLLCVDRSLGSDANDAFARRADVFFFKRRIEIEAFLAHLERTLDERASGARC